jgi:hypothetical protein
MGYTVSLLITRQVALRFFLKKKDDVILMLIIRKMMSSDKFNSERLVAESEDRRDQQWDYRFVIFYLMCYPSNKRAFS